MRKRATHDNVTAELFMSEKREQRLIHPHREDELASTSQDPCQ